MRALAQVLRGAGHDVRILGPASGAAPVLTYGLPGVVAIPANGSVARIGLLVSRRAVARYLSGGHFHLVHVHEPYVPGTARLAVRYARAPVVATFHAYVERERLLSRLARQAMARPLVHVQRAIAVSGAAAASARRIYDGPLAVIPNGIDTAAFMRGAVQPPRRCAPTPLRILFVGRYDEPRKGLAHLLDAAAHLRSNGRDVRVRIVRRGNPDAFAEPARRAGAEFSGRLSDAALVAAYHECHLFCAPSTRGESFGLVLLEAMACGRPVVASDIRGYREAAAGAAHLVHPGDMGALATALRQVADDETLRRDLVERGRRRAADLDWRRISHRIVAFYERVAASSYPTDRPVTTAARA